MYKKSSLSLSHRGNFVAIRCGTRSRKNNGDIRSIFTIKPENLVTRGERVHSLMTWENFRNCQTCYKLIWYLITF